MKKIGVIILAVLLLLSLLGGCTATSATGVQIVCSAFPQYDFLREITRGADVSLKLLLKPGQESHDYDPSSRDIAAVHASDMFVYVGGESESWIAKTLQSVDTQNKTVLKLVDMVEPMEEHAGHDHAYDEHVWTSPANAIDIAKELCDALVAIDPQNADTYRKNLATYTDKLSDLCADFEDAVKNGKRQTIVVGDRFPLLYFCEEFGLSHFAAFAGCAASTEPSSADVAALIDVVKKQNIPVVFQMEMSAGGVAETIAESTGAQVRTFYSCHNLSKTDFEAGETYLSLMQKNLTVLKEALG